MLNVILIVVFIVNFLFDIKVIVSNREVKKAYEENTKISEELNIKLIAHHKIALENNILYKDLSHKLSAYNKRVKDTAKLFRGNRYTGIPKI